MLAVITRVSEAAVESDGVAVARIGRGYLVLVGVLEGDTDADAEWLARKICALRVFEDADERMNLGLSDINGAILTVSNFTLAADCRNGNRPSFSAAAEPTEANRLYTHFVARCRADIPDVQTGVFQTHMHVTSLNDGPVTIVLDSATRLSSRR